MIAIYITTILQGRRIQDRIQITKLILQPVYLGWQPIAHIEHEVNGDVKLITYLTGDQMGTPRLGTSQTENKVVVWRMGGVMRLVQQNPIITPMAILILLR